jgi:NADH dehydrogenase [ubiquinone] 1 alpha subcomplex assembly factor 1
MKTMSDSSVGGFSTSQLTQIPSSTDPQTSEPVPAHALFHGNISTKLPSNRPEVQRTGYAAFRNADRGRTAFGKLFWDIDPYMYLALRVKSDGRRYFVNIQTDSIVETDIHQHRLYTHMHQGSNTDDPSAPAQWETVLIKFHEFVRTNHGVVTEPQSEMLRQKVKSFGIGLIDRQEGPFELAIGAMWATNLNERGQIDGRTDHEEGDPGSARLSEVTEEKLAQKAEERARLPERKMGFRERLPEHFGKVGTGAKGRVGN